MDLHIRSKERHSDTGPCCRCDRTDECESVMVGGSEGRSVNKMLSYNLGPNTIDKEALPIFKYIYICISYLASFLSEKATTSLTPSLSS